jgi:putative endonuclease
MTRERQGGWVYIMANRYRGKMYVGLTSDLAARAHQHRTGTGSEYCAEHGLTRLVWANYGEDIRECIAHEKRLKRWRRAWKFDLIERANPDWRDLFDDLA